MATAPTKQDAIDRALAVDGWLTRDEAGTLYELAGRAQGPVVEIGSWRGRSTIALALGSRGQQIYAIDSFVGCPGEHRECSERMLRDNLDAASVNGQAVIVAADAADAVRSIPTKCGLLFIDGAHDYRSALRDLSLYLPLVGLRGFVVVHDADSSAPGVCQAVEETLTGNPHWRCRGRVDSSLIFERRETPRYSVLLGFPGNSLYYGTHIGLQHATLGAHDIKPEQSGMGWDDMNRLWCFALNQAHLGRVTHFAMLHSDVQPSPGWVDLLIDELDDRKADLISAVVALKDENGLTSCGIGDAANPWQPFRRFAMRELVKMPETFGIEDTPHTSRFLLHNTGCLVADLRNPLWRTVDGDGALVASFAFPIRGRLSPSGDIIHERESEDWYFSRKAAELGLRTLATRRVVTIHYGQQGFRNDAPWGRMEHDEPTKDRWSVECPTF